VAAFILATAVPIFSDLIGIAAALFAAWYTYGIAGFFWLYDTYHLGNKSAELKRRWVGTTLAVLTILAGAFISVAGTYVSIKVSRLKVTRLLKLIVASAYRRGISTRTGWETFHLLM
jgi:hypothetical protein